MSDNYQAVYDAVRSRMGNVDVGSAISEAMRQANIGHYVEQAKNEVAMAAYEFMRPCVLYRPRIFTDDGKWCALYGDDLLDGCGGFGESIAEAMADFDKNWNKKLNKEAP